MKRKAVFSIVLIGLLLLVGGLAYFHFVVKPQMIQQFMSQAPQPVMTVTAEEARAESWVQTLTAAGTMRAVRGVELANQVDGVVRSINFNSGEEVAAGVSLLQIDDSVEQADLKSAIAELRRANADFERQSELVSRGASARSNYDLALSQRDTAAAAIERLRALIAKKNIQAPFAGKLGIRRVDVGQYLPVGTVIAPLQSIDPIYADFPLPEHTFNAVKVGQDVEVALDAYPGVVFRGRVQSVDARVSAETRSFLVRAEIGNADKRAVPGMFANVSVLTGVVQNVLTVPRTAVTYSLYGDNVLVVTDGPADPGQLQRPQVVDRRFIRTGEVRGERIAIVEGLKPGELVVTTGQIKLDPGVRVRVDNAAMLKPLAPRPKE